MVSGSAFGIFCVPLSFAVKQGAVAALGVFVALAVSRAGETAGTGQPLAEAADASEHIDKLDGVAFPLKRKIARRLYGRQ